MTKPIQIKCEDGRFTIHVVRDGVVIAEHVMEAVGKDGALAHVYSMPHPRPPYRSKRGRGVRRVWPDGCPTPPHGVRLPASDSTSPATADVSDPEHHPTGS